MTAAVVFDLDGTLIDSTQAIVESFFHTFAALDIPPPPREAIVRTIGHTLEDQFRLFTHHDTDECVRVYRAHYGATACSKTTLLPGALAALDRLRRAGLRLAFATSKRRIYAELILDHLGVLAYFEGRIGPDDVARPKPHPDVVIAALGALNVAANEAVFVGDTEFDVLAARNAHVRCLGVATGYNTREELLALEPEAVFDSLGEATDHILAHRTEPPPRRRP